MQVTSEGSVRVDLVGGTLDLEPINLILKNVVTLNVATSLKAKVIIEKVDSTKIEIHSLDYDKIYSIEESELTEDNLFYSNHFKEISFVLQIVDLFEYKKGLKITLSSGAPAGSGLGGSSAMGMTLFKALAQLNNLEYEVHEAVAKVKSIEGRILNQGIPGYQDYYPAMLGGILSLKGKPGKIECEQLFSKPLKDFLEQHITLVYSGISRNSGINNWDVYKKFFDGNKQTRSGLNEIATISHQTYEKIKNNQFEDILTLIGQEGELRKQLASGIVPQEIEDIFSTLKSDDLVLGLKMCGAGGGGCFILTHKKDTKVALEKRLAELNYTVLNFEIERPL